MNTTTPSHSSPLGGECCHGHSPHAHYHFTTPAEGMTTSHSTTPRVVHHYIHYISHCAQTHATPLTSGQTHPQKQELENPEQQAPEQEQYPSPPIHPPPGHHHHRCCTGPWIQPPGWQSSSSGLLTALPGCQWAQSLHQFPYQHQYQQVHEQCCPSTSTKTSANASAPPSEARSESTSSVNHPPSHPGSSSGHVPQADRDRNIKVLADERSSKTSVLDQSVVSIAFGKTSRAMGKVVERERQQQEEKKRRAKETQAAKRKYASARNLEAYEGVKRRYMLLSGEPILKILKDKATTVVEEENEGDVTEYDSDDDGGWEGEGEDQEVIAQRYNDFVLAVGIYEPLDTAGQKIVSTYLGTYLLSRLEYARARHFDMRGVRSNMAEKTMLWVQNQKRVPETWTWSSQKWNREMNEAIRHHKKTDTHWHKRMNVLEERLTKSWKENIEGARRELQSKAN